MVGLGSATWVAGLLAQAANSHNAKVKRSSMTSRFFNQHLHPGMWPLY
jgi:hypothetical protein